MHSYNGILLKNDPPPCIAEGENGTETLVGNCICLIYRNYWHRLHLEREIRKQFFMYILIFHCIPFFKHLDFVPFVCIMYFKDNKNFNSHNSDTKIPQE